MREDHNTEKPTESSGAHEKGNKDSPPKNGTITFLFFGKTPTTIRAVFASIAQKSNMHSICEKIIVVNKIKYLKF
jgi:hypothetical protein